MAVRSSIGWLARVIQKCVLYTIVTVMAFMRVCIIVKDRGESSSSSALLLHVDLVLYYNNVQHI